MVPLFVCFIVLLSTMIDVTASDYNASLINLRNAVDTLKIHFKDRTNTHFGASILPGLSRILTVLTDDVIVCH